MPWLIRCLQVLDKGEVAPGLHFSELQQRRQNLANLMPPGSVAIIPAASLAYVTGVIPYPYRQDADFLYMTGIQQQAVALIRTGGASQAWAGCFICSRLTFLCCSESGCTHEASLVATSHLPHCI